MTQTTSTENAKSTIRATVARALAEALILGIDECAQTERPLSQLQQVDLAAMTVMSYDNAIEACENLTALDVVIARRH